VARALEALAQAAGTTANLLPSLIDAVTAYATVGEICDVLRAVFGVHAERTRY
jgi:methylmalonyl-CoA mutase N-terminal domain/subunit